MWTDLEITVNGETLLLDACGAAFAKAHSTLIFADLHLEKGSSYARDRQFLPPYDTDATLLRMAAAVRKVFTDPDLRAAVAAHHHFADVDLRPLGHDVRDVRAGLVG